MPIKNKILLQKNIGQIKFRPTMDTYSKVPEVVSKFEEDFKDWVAEKNSLITLFSAEEKKLLQLSYEGTTCIYEDVKSLEEQDEDVEKISDYIEESFKLFSKSLKEIRRVGFRTTILIDAKLLYKDLVDLVFTKFYSDNIKQEKTLDVVFVLDFEEEGFSNHIQIGPVRKNEWEKYFNNKFKIESIDFDACIFIDLDTYILEDMAPEDCIAKFKKAIELNFKINNKYIDYLFE